MSARKSSQHYPIADRVMEILRWYSVHSSSSPFGILVPSYVTWLTRRRKYNLWKRHGVLVLVSSAYLNDDWWMN